MSDHIYEQRYPQRIKEIYTCKNQDLAIKSDSNKKLSIEVPTVMPNLIQGYLALNENKQIISVQSSNDALLDKIDELEQRIKKIEEQLSQTNKSSWF